MSMEKKCCEINVRENRMANPDIPSTLGKQDTGRI